MITARGHPADPTVTSNGGAGAGQALRFLSLMTS
jgi:hypothetical protein